MVANSYCILVSNRIQWGEVNTFVYSESFEEWLLYLTDEKAKARIVIRIRNAGLGNFGDCQPVGEGVYEMRIHIGAGYRVYYVRTGTTFYFVLAGGDKSSQKKDIAIAKKMAREIKKDIK